MSNKIFNQDMAKAFATHEDNIADIIYSQEWRTFFKRNRNHYQQMESQDFLNVVINFITKAHQNQNHTMATYNDIINQLKTFTVRNYPSVDTPYIALNDKLLNTETLELEEFTKEKIAIHHIPIDSDDLTQPTTTFTNYLNTTIVHSDDHSLPDQPLIDLVQEMFGFYITPNLKAEGMFFLVGKGSNGKSVMIKILEEMIGKRYCSAMSIQTLTTNQFATHNLIGKKLNVCNEEESKFLRADKFKALVTGDTIQVEQKGKDSFTFSPTTKYCFGTQDIPNFSEVDGGIMRRVKIIPFNRVFTDEHKDKDISEKLQKEMGGILQFAIEGARRLKENNYNFSKPAQFVQALDEFESDLSSPVRFFKEYYKIKDNTTLNTVFLSNKQIYKAYEAWSKEEGRKVKNATNFHKDILNQIPFYKENRGRKRVDGKAERGLNLTYTEAGKPDLYIDDAEETVESLIDLGTF